MPNRGSNLDILKALFNVAPEVDESYNEFCKRVVIIINQDEDNWENLPEAVQLWYTDIAKALEETGKSADEYEYQDFPGMSRTDYEETSAPEKTVEKKVKKTVEKKEKALVEKKEKKEKKTVEKKEKKPANSSFVRNKVFTSYGITFAEVLAAMKDEGLEAKESSVRIVFTSANKDLEMILALGKVTNKDGKDLLVAA